MNEKQEKLRVTVWQDSGTNPSDVLANLKIVAEAAEKASASSSDTSNKNIAIAEANGRFD